MADKTKEMLEAVQWEVSIEYGTHPSDKELVTFLMKALVSTRLSLIQSQEALSSLQDRIREIEIVVAKLTGEVH